MGGALSLHFAGVLLALSEEETISEDELVTRFDGRPDAVPVLAAALSHALDELKACACCVALCASQVARGQIRFLRELLREDEARALSSVPALVAPGEQIQDAAFVGDPHLCVADSHPPEIVSF